MTFKSFAASILLIGLSSQAATVNSFPAQEKDAVPDAVMLRLSTQYISEMREILKASLHKLEEARNSRDVVTLNYVNEKLTQIKGLLRISEQSDIDLQEAIARRDHLAASHAFEKISIAHRKVVQLRDESDQFVGQLAFRTDQNLSVEVELPENLPGSNIAESPAPTAPLVAPPPLVSRPASATPGQ